MDSRESVFCTKYSRVDIYSSYVVKNYLEPDEDRELIENEVYMLRKLSDTGFVPVLLGFSFDKLKLERCFYGSLRYLISSDSDILGEKFKVKVVDDCESVLSYLHGVGIVHGDFTSFNILVDCGFKIKVCDFMTSGEGFINNCASRWRRDGANEINKFEHDWFALGIVVWELIMMSGPYFWLDDGSFKLIQGFGVRLYCKPHTLKRKYIKYVSE